MATTVSCVKTMNNKKQLQMCVALLVVVSAVVLCGCRTELAPVDPSVTSRGVLERIGASRSWVSEGDTARLTRGALVVKSWGPEAVEFKSGGSDTLVIKLGTPSKRGTTVVSLVIETDSTGTRLYIPVDSLAKVLVVPLTADPSLLPGIALIRLYLVDNRGERSRTVEKWLVVGGSTTETGSNLVGGPWVVTKFTYSLGGGQLGAYLQAAAKAAGSSVVGEVVEYREDGVVTLSAEPGHFTYEVVADQMQYTANGQRGARYTILAATPMVLVQKEYQWPFRYVVMKRRAGK